MAFPKKISSFGRFSSLPPMPPPPQKANLILIVVSPSLMNPTPATCHKRKQKLRCNLRKWRCRSCTATFAFLRSAEVIFTKFKAALQQAKNCSATLKTQALQERGAFLPVSCGFQAPTFRPPCLGPADLKALKGYQASNRGSKGSRKNSRGSKRLGAVFLYPIALF